MSVPPVQFRHLPMPFHWKQEELKFTTALQRLQHRVGEARLLREALQPGAEAGQGGSVGPALREGSGEWVGVTPSWTSPLTEPQIYVYPLFLPSPSVSLHNLLDAPANGKGPSEVIDGLRGGVWTQKYSPGGISALWRDGD